MTGQAGDLWVPKGQDPRIHWLNRGRAIAERLAHHQWELGDWWRDRPDGATTTDDVADDLGLASATLWYHGWLAGRFPAARRRPLSHAHHATVAALPASTADALLDQAVAEKWSVARIRQAARQVAREQEIEAERAAQAEQRELDLHPNAVAWRTDAKRVERECRERLVTAEVMLRSAVDALEALADHPGANLVHGNRRRAAAERLRSVLAPGDTGIDLTPHVQPLLDRIWSQSP